MPRIDCDFKLQVYPFIYIIDSSILPQHMAFVNEVMSETYYFLREVWLQRADSEIRVGVLQLDSKEKWITNGLIYLDDFFWDSNKVEVMLKSHDAPIELDKEISSIDHCAETTIIFIGDSEKMYEYLKKNNSNQWLTYANKVVIAIDNDVEKGFLEDFIDNKGQVISVCNMDCQAAVNKIYDELRMRFVSGNSNISTSSNTSCMDDLGPWDWDSSDDSTELEDSISLAIEELVNEFEEELEAILRGDVADNCSSVDSRINNCSDDEWS